VQKITRRTFVAQTLGASAFLAGCRAAPGGGRPTAADWVDLGESGVAVPRLAMGTGTHGWKKASDQTRLGREAFSRLVAHGVERGAAFIDAADLYGSHELVRHALRDGAISRDRVAILSKIWHSEAPEMVPSTDAVADVERFCREMGVDEIDVCLLHCVQDPAWPDQLERHRDGLSSLKERGLVRAVGCSCHTHASLRVAAEHPWVDVLLARINPHHKRMDEDASTEDVVQTLELARAAGKGVLGMKIFGCGDLTAPEQRRESLRLALGTGLMDAATIGFTAPEQIDDAMDRVDEVLVA